MEKIEDNSLESAKRRFIVSLVILILAVLYLLFPLDFIPDVLFPAGYLDDIPLLIASALYAGYSYRKMKRERESISKQER